MNAQEITLMEHEAKPKKSLFLWELGVFIALIFARNVLGVPIPVNLLLLITGVIALTGSREDIITLGICCIPFFVAFQYKYSLLLCIVIYIIKYPHDVKLNQNALPLLIMMLWEFLHAFRYDFQIYEFFRNFAEMIFCTFLMLNAYKKINYARVCRILAVCTLCMVVFVLWNQLKEANFNLATVFSGTYRLGMEEEAENFAVVYNPNALGFMCLLPVMGFVQLFFANHRRKSDYVLTALLLICGVFTMSKTFIFCVGILGLMLIWVWKKDVGGRIKSFAFVAIALAALFALLYVLTPYIIEAVIARFREADLTNGRVRLFAFYHEFILSSSEYLYFGVGLQDMRDKIQEIFGMNITITNVSHNGLQEIVLAWGLPGLAMFAAFIWCLITASKTPGVKRTFISFIPLALTLIKAQAGQLISSSVTMLAFAFIYLGLYQDFGREKNDCDG